MKVDVQKINKINKFKMIIKNKEKLRVIMQSKKVQTRKAQSEVITTVLLILIGIAAVAILSAFVINMVRSNLRGTECFDSLGQAKIDLDSSWTFFNYTSGNLSLTISRETKDFDLTGFNIVYGNDLGSKKVKLEDGKETTGVWYVKSSTVYEKAIVLPQPGESKTYLIDPGASLGNGNYTTVTLALILNENTECEKVDEQTVTLKP